MTLLSSFTSWTGYAGHLVAKAAIAERMAEKQLKRVEDIYTIRYKSEKTVAATKAMVSQEEEYQEADAKVDRCYMDRKLLESTYSDLERKGNTVSRELSRRISRRSSENRSDKYNT
jgi:hypothetical protein